MGHAILDTVLGLAITPSTIGWVMADAGDSGCPTVAGDEVGFAGGDAGPDAVDLAMQAATVTARIRTLLAASGERLHGVAVTWSDDAAVGAALLLESLADAGVDHVVPVRYGQAAAALAAGIGPRHARSAVCVVEADTATLALFDHLEAPDPIITACPITAIDDVLGWLADTLGSDDQRPEVLMVAGSVRGMDRLGRRLESRLSIPVFVQGGALQALARGAALALAPQSELTAAPLEPLAADPQIDQIGRRRARSLSYAAALLMLAGGSVTLVGSVAAAVSMQLGPSRVVPNPTPPQRATVVRVAVPAAAPVVVPAPPPPSAEPAGTGEEAPGEFGSLWDAPTVDADLSESSPGRIPAVLDRIREHIAGLADR